MISHATPSGRAVFLIATVIACLYAGSKPSTNGTNRVMSVHRPLPTAAAPHPAIVAWSVRTNATASFAMPAGATMATNWHLRGAFEDVTRLGGRWATPSGVLRRTLADVSNDIVAVGAPMSAVPFRSRLWTARGTNGSEFVTWENFFLNRDINTPVSAQVEFLPNGEYVTRSNEVETAYGRLGPDPSLPPGADESAYCWIALSAAADAHVVFAGDGPSNLPDPVFAMRAGETYRVNLLIGKRYDVACTQPVAVTARQTDDITVDFSDPCHFRVVWPLVIGTEPPPTPLQLRSLPAASFGEGGFTLYPTPDWINGFFRWSTNTCCEIEEVDWHVFRCADDCPCSGCPLGGWYDYEGYSLPFGGIGCGCRHEPHPYTHYAVSATSVGFKGGTPGFLGVNFTHGNPDQPEAGTLRLEVSGGDGKIRLWQDAAKTAAATTFEWTLPSFSGCGYYIEWLGKSGSPEDIRFTLSWTAPGGLTHTVEARSTCVELTGIAVSARRADGIPLANGAPTDSFFPAGSNGTFDITHSPLPDPHFSVLYRDVASNDLSVADFSVDLELAVEPEGAHLPDARWILLDGPSAGGPVANGARTCALVNPKTGGVWHIGACFADSPTNTCTVVLPLAGAETGEILRGDLNWADRFVRSGRERLPKRWFERIKFGLKWFNWLENGYYRGRPDNRDSPTVWFYNQVNDTDGLGAVGTLFGHSVRVEKLSNFIAGYTCVKLGVPWTERVLSQAIGTSNDDSAHLSWQAGEAVASGADFDRAISYFVNSIRLEDDAKTGRLWPNPVPADNHRGAPGHGDFNVEFSSPGFIYAQP